MFDKGFWIPVGVIALTLVLLVGTVLGVAHMFNIIPPGRGTVVEMGHHPAFFPTAFCNEERYYIVIERPDGNQRWTWYIDEWYWRRWEVGDKVGFWEE